MTTRTPFRPPVATLRDNFRQSIREICAHAAPRGTILLEPLNTYEGIPGC